MNNAYLLLGGNQGNVLQTLRQAVNFLNGIAGNIIAMSALYRSEPWGFDSRDLFINQVVEIETILQPLDLLNTILGIEQALGRTRTTNLYESRNIDIDILFYNDWIIEAGGLVVPHTRLHLRRFTLLPLCEIAPGFIHPVIKKSLANLLLQCPDRSLVEKV